MFTKIKTRPLFLLVNLWVLFSLAACSLPTRPGNEPPAAQTEIAPTESLSVTDTPQPTSTPLSPLVIFLVSAESDARMVEALQPVIEELAAQSALRFEKRSTLQSGELGAEARLVVAVPPDVGVAALAAASPQTQFLAVGIPDLLASQNISTLASTVGRPDRQGFLAGYLAAVITPDWRVGVISRSDTASGKAARQAFRNGVVFFCGLCRPTYPPFIQYPVFAELPSGASQAEQQAAADQMIGSSVTTVYVHPGVGEATMLAYLAQQGIRLIGGGDPAPELAGHWVASLHGDLGAAVRQLWPDLISGKGGLSLDLPLAITHMDPALLSLGRQRLVENLLAELSGDYIDTGVDPATGELR